MTSFFKKSKVSILIFVVLFATVTSYILIKSFAAAAPPPAKGYFQLTTPGTAFKSDAECANEVHYSDWEPRSSNYKQNHDIPTQPPVVRDHPDFDSTWNSSYRSRIDGNFQGTTDEIIQWAACKWGWSDEVVRAEGVDESEWDMTSTGDNEPQSNGHCPQGVTSNPCPTSYGFLQIKWYYNPDTNPVNNSYPLSKDSTAFSLDYALAWLRGCYDGHSSYLNNSQIKGDMWGCLGYWFSGGWRDSDAIDYITRIQQEFCTVSTSDKLPNDKYPSCLSSAKPWLKWPDQGGGGSSGGGGNDTTAPTVSLTAPANGSTTSGSVNLTATASDNVGVVGVQFQVDGTNVGSEDTTSPYSSLWNTTTIANGTHKITAIARDAAGNKTTSSTVSVTVNNTTADTTKPTTSITAPTNNSAVSGTTSIVAAAADNVGVSKVEFYIDGTLHTTVKSPGPYTDSWNTAGLTNGSTHTIMTKAYDAAGNVGQSSTVTVTVSNADTTKPTTSITAPTNGATVSGTTTVSASASDNVGVSRVEFYLDGTLISTDTSSPYSFGWNTAGTTDGTHTLQTKAYDGSGNVGQSSTVTVTVNNAPPPPPPSNTSLRINTGGGQVTGILGAIWSADKYATGGTIDDQASGHDIANTPNDNLYQDERYGTMTYNLPLPNGKYNLSLYFAEIYPGCQKVNCRVFNVKVNGQSFLNNFDIFSKVGGYAADMEQTTATVSNQNLAISFSESSLAPNENPQIAAMEVSPVVTLGAPTGLTGSATSDSSVKLSWKAPSNTSGITGYYVQRDGVTLANLASSATTYTDSTVNGNTTYKYTILAHDSGFDVSAPSNTVSVTTPTPADTTPPSAPANVKATAISPTQVNLSWSASTDSGSGVVGYVIYRNGTPLNIVAVGTTTYGDATVTANTTYSYYVVAVDAAINISKNSAQVNVTTPAATNARTITLLPTDDSFINKSSPSSNYGTNTSLVTDTNLYTYLKFNVTGLSGLTVTSAKLVLTNANNGSSSGGYLRRTIDTSWKESTITYNNFPQTDWSSPFLAQIGSIAANNTVNLNLTNAVTGNGVYGFTLYNGISDSVTFNSKEAGSNPPQLILTVQ